LSTGSCKRRKEMKRPPSWILWIHGPCTYISCVGDVVGPYLINRAKDGMGPTSYLSVIVWWLGSELVEWIGHLDRIWPVMMYKVTQDDTINYLDVTFSIRAP
jgi:hypothetical protein